MRSILCILIVGAAIAGLSGEAAAETVDLTQNPPPNGQFNFKDYSVPIWNGSTLDIRATAERRLDGPGNPWVPALVHKNNVGLGVVSQVGDNRQVDGRDYNERISLTVLSSPVDPWLAAAEFANVTGNDDAWIFVDGTLLYGGKIVNPPGHFVGPDNYQAFFGHLPLANRMGTVFTFAARHNNDNWRLASVNVPEPGVTLLFGVAAFGFLALRRRRQAA